MGGRQYVPGVGCFIEVDPIEGGSANDYDYVDGDPINGFDLEGTASINQKMNAAERNFCKVPWHVMKCNFWAITSSIAIDATRNLSGGLANAFRHVIWSAIMTWYMSVSDVEGFRKDVKVMSTQVGTTSPTSTIMRLALRLD